MRLYNALDWRTGLDEHNNLTWKATSAISDEHGIRFLYVIHQNYDDPMITNYVIQSPSTLVSQEDMAKVYSTLQDAKDVCQRSEDATYMRQRMPANDKQTISFFVPGHPVGKGRGRAGIGAGGHAMVYADPKTVREEWNLLGLARPYIPRRLLQGAIELSVVVYLVVPKSASKVKRERMLAGKILPTKKPDVDNLTKIIMDAFNGRFYLDDAQITDEHMKKRYAEAPGLHITISEIGEEA